jgi:AcrR family transcriptional regulator
MSDIANIAEISQGLAYRYFSSKEVLLQTLVKQMVEQSDSSPLSQILKKPGTPGERLDFLISLILNGRREKPEFFQLFYQVLHDETMPEELREMVHARGQIFKNVLRQLIVEGQATGEIAQDDPDQLLSAVMACIGGLWQGMALIEPEEVKKHFPDAKIVLRMLKPYPDQK